MAYFCLAGAVCDRGFYPEYFLRIISWPNPLKLYFQLLGIIDLATILPLYVMWLWPEISLNYVFAWRAMRAIRALRILKLLRFMPSLNIFWRLSSAPAIS
jgi:voltage-gated potassium channel